MKKQIRIIIPKPYTDAQGNRLETMVETAENIFFPLDTADYVIDIPLPIERPFSIKFIENNSIVTGFRIFSEIEENPLQDMLDNL